VSNVIQLGFDERDNKLWWVDQWLWDDDTISSIQRPTEIAAFRQMYRQSRLLKKHGVFINLSPLHRQIMVMEYSALNNEPKPDNIYNWISARVRGIPPLQVKRILEECSLVVLLREVLSLPELVIDWPLEDVAKRKAA
jgi:hypothetical protein